MSHSYRSMLFHIVFATKERQPLIGSEIRHRLYGYIDTIIEDRFGHPIRIGGVEDHIHILMDKKPGVNEINMLRDIKAFSSGWIHKTFPRLAGFAWQAGYGIFSVSGSHKETLIGYIENQSEHHKKVTLQEEFRRLLERNGLEFDEKHIV